MNTSQCGCDKGKWQRTALRTAYTVMACLWMPMGGCASETKVGYPVRWNVMAYEGPGIYCIRDPEKNVGQAGPEGQSVVKVRVNVVNCTPKAIMLLADETAVEYKGLIGIVPVGGGGTMRYGKPKSWWPGPAQRWYRVRPVDVDPPLKAGEPIPRKNGACLEFDILLPLGPGLIEYADMEWVLPIWYYMLEGEPVYGDDLQEKERFMFR